ncbi:MAG TPA: hypothetical protein VKA70_08350 [Blastocatellia bacterium]|nr:hypothetical protein [Blastocatellia bacterium]
MFKRRRIWFLAITLLALVVIYFTTRGPEEPVPNPPGTFTFAVLGDAPYYTHEELQFKLVLESLDRNDLSFVIHVGDIFWRPCSDAHYRKSLDRFNGLRHALIYTPGDNEWADCWEKDTGGFEPLDRLAKIREIFFSDPTHSLGGNRLSLVTQAGREPFPEFVENARWVHEGVVFATAHIVGSKNGLAPFPARTQADDQESKRRTEAAAAWVRETFAEARNLNASAVVISYHASADLEEPHDNDYRRAFDPFILAIEEEADRFARPVLLAHGDGHDYTVDHPLVRRATGKPLENVTRLQVPGSPLVGWVRVVVTPGATQPFSFDQHVVPRWKYW